MSESRQGHGLWLAAGVVALVGSVAMVATVILWLVDGYRPFNDGASVFDLILGMHAVEAVLLALAGFFALRGKRASLWLVIGALAADLVARGSEFLWYRLNDIPLSIDEFIPLVRLSHFSDWIEWYSIEYALSAATFDLSMVLVFVAVVLLLVASLGSAKPVASAPAWPGHNPNQWP